MDNDNITTLNASLASLQVAIAAAYAFIARGRAEGRGTDGAQELAAMLAAIEQSLKVSVNSLKISQGPLFAKAYDRSMRHILDTARESTVFDRRNP